MLLFERVGRASHRPCLGAQLLKASHFAGDLSMGRACGSLRRRPPESLWQPVELRCGDHVKDRAWRAKELLQLAMYRLLFLNEEDGVSLKAAQQLLGELGAKAPPEAFAPLGDGKSMQVFRC